jgi:RNA polymerase sigma-70 factor (ECF subfamily)
MAAWPNGFPSDETLRELQPKIVEFFRRRLPAHVDPSDMVAEVMLAFAKYRGEASPKHYAFMVARRLLAQHHRQPRRVERVSSSHEFADPRTGLSSQLERREVVQVVRSEAAEIEQPFADVVQLSLDGLSPQEIAGRLGVNANTVRSRLARGLARVRERLVDAFESGPL